ncbi:MAG: VWA domain-containing protein [Bryobacterales bacterium]
MALTPATKREKTPALDLSAGAFSVVLGLLAVAVVFGQQAPSEARNDFTIAVDVDRVVLDVTVTDRKGRWISGLGAGNFRILEDGKEQTILDVTQEDRPLTLGLVIDSSRSVGERRAEIIEGAMRLAALSRDDDDLFLVSFNDVPRLGLSGPESFTRHLPTLRHALFEMVPDGRTALYDAVAVALDKLAQGKWDRQAAVIFSDGGDTASLLTLDQTLDRVRRSNALVYAIGLASEINPYRSSKTLKQLAHASGGEAFFPTERKSLQRVCETIAHEIRSQYTLTYAPSNSRQEGAYRKIEIEVRGEDGKKLDARTREGYFEPRCACSARSSRSEDSSQRFAHGDLARVRNPAADRRDRQPHGLRIAQVRRDSRPSRT